MASAVFDSDARRNLVQQHQTLNGIDYLEVDTEPAANKQRVLRVYFLPPDPADDVALIAKVNALLTALAQPDQRANLVISGGVRTTDIKLIAVERVGDHLRLRVDKPGDFSDYTLTITNPALDPFFQQIAFNFKAGCPSRFDCKPRQECPPEILTAPPIDYMAKDYDSFRQALIDFLPTIIPGWTERREADLGITLLELFAYMGDQLSYFQDTVANEAYLETARQRISVRRHARLIDYAMHDGMSAMTFLHFEVTADTTITGIPHIQALTLPHALPNAASVIALDVATVALDSADAVFEVLLKDGEAINFSQRLNRIAIYDWLNDFVYLPRGATSADLVGDLPLKIGDFVLFEEMLSPDTGEVADRDPTNRQIVRLTNIAFNVDPLAGQKYARVEWSSDDALRFPVCVATKDRDGRQLRNVSVARGNLVAAYHGRTVQETHAVTDPETLVATGLVEAPPSLSGYRFALNQAPLGYLPAADLTTMSMTQLQALSPRSALPAVINLTETVGIQKFEWNAVTPDLLASSRFAQHFMVETDNDNRAFVRFGDNQFGLIPAASARLTIDYRVGVGRGGNVGADTLVCFIKDTSAPALERIRSVRNPLPAWGWR